MQVLPTASTRTKEPTVKTRNLIRLAAASVLSSALVVGCASEEDEPEVSSTMAPLHKADPAAKIEGQYIVVFKDDVAISGKGMNAAMAGVSLRSPESKIDVQYDIIPAFAAKLDAEDLDALRNNPDVAFVEEDQ